ncbi:HAD family hydrolase [Phytoactinopolyspora mesophila]|uniref:HAD-IA family hydrolase n=1 Tax=Phytoactinopolyspora mesophila TaxID=2650750 RepID=A0A7K3M091_9ACTN|nr:HAD family hydrolase [Phytoactinopolyspora mesophila]NDL56715.1 HAD-IA family hydrolase [Phytoactinopolyspora mesophila]
MTLLLLDLDDTLLDRTAAMRAWAQRFLGEIDAPQSDIDWLLNKDAGAPLPLREFVVDLKDRYGLEGTLDEVAEGILEGLVSGMTVEPVVASALKAASDGGWTTFIVTNGSVAAQEPKIRTSGLDAMVDGWIISEEADVWKPDPLIFELAAERARAPLGGAWMIGDNPASDIAGAHRAGISSVWMHRGRVWAESEFQPTASAGSCAEAIHLVLESNGSVQVSGI